MMPGPLISVAPDLISKTREGGLLLISGFREADLPAIRRAFEPHFHIPPAPTSERLGRPDEAGGKWIAFACTRAAGTSIDISELSDSAL